MFIFPISFKYFFKSLSTLSYPKENIPLGPKILEVENLCSGRLFEDVSFYVRAGEIVGFAGLIGSGRTEVMSSLFSLVRIDSGVVVKGGKELDLRQVQDSVSAGSAMLSEDRRRLYARA